MPFRSFWAVRTLSEEVIILLAEGTQKIYIMTHTPFFARYGLPAGGT